MRLPTCVTIRGNSLSDIADKLQKTVARFACHCFVIPIGSCIFTPAEYRYP